jgi:protein PhnA
MSELPPCPKCQSVYTYPEGDTLACPECGHVWSASTTTATTEAVEEGLVVRDANGTRLQDGDSVTVIKDLKVKGSSSALKVGTKVRNIRLVEGDHNIDCKIEGFGAMQLKSEYVRKST